MQHGFIWCPHCGEPHGLPARFCPKNGQALDRATHRRPVRSHPLLGRIIEKRYRVVDLIGRGGKGLVFGAEDLRTSGHVAIKVVTEADKREDAWRLLQEARMVAALRHPNICTLLDLGQHADVGPYIVMERLFGETLYQRIRAAGPIPLDVALDLLLQVLSALDAAHGAKVIHRDIKPSNIFVTGRAGMPPHAKVLDFGYARQLDRNETRLTRPGLVVGTPFYLAPEVLRGDDGTHLSDLFAWGMVAFEALTGKMAYYGNTYPEFLAAIRRGKRRRLLDLRPDAPPVLAELLDRTLSRDPTRRPQSALELYTEVRRMVAQLPPVVIVPPLGASASAHRGAPPVLWEEESSTSVSRRRR